MQVMKYEQNAMPKLMCHITSSISVVKRLHRDDLMCIGLLQVSFLSEGTSNNMNVSCVCIIVISVTECMFVYLMHSRGCK